MSLAREILEKIVKGKEKKGEPEPLPLESPVEPGKPPVADPVRECKPELEMTAPIPILSQYLDGEIVYIVQDEATAMEVERQGHVAITPQEVEALKALHQSTDRDEWISYLKAVYQAKKVFEGSRVINGRA